MARALTREQREAELAVVAAALSPDKWARPCHIASKTNLKTAVVLSALRELGAARREYLIPRLHQGADRTRKTSRLIVEYQRPPATLVLALFPSFLLQPPKEHNPWQNHQSPRNSGKKRAHSMK